MSEIPVPSVSHDPERSVSDRSPEKTPNAENFIHNFLRMLAEDHPELAQEILTTRFPDYILRAHLLWQEFKDEVSKKEKSKEVDEIKQQMVPDQEFIAALLEGMNHLRYISREETERVMREYAAEVEAVLLSDASIMLIFTTEYAGKTSETYFARMVHQMLPLQLQARVLFSSEVVREEIPRSLSDRHYIIYRFDDSSNSGAQVNASIRSFIGEHGKRSRHLDFRIRLIAGGSENQDENVKERVGSWVEKNGPLGAHYTLDWKQKYLNSRIEVLYKGLSVTLGTSIVFSHKIQDNLPELYVSLYGRHRKDKPHLFEMDDDIRPPYKR